MQNIESAIQEIHKHTCVRFIPRTGRETAFVRITNSHSGCWSSVGRTGSLQEINLQTPACARQVGTIVHELTHAIGFLHEQNREDRDEYIRILWNNIRKGNEMIY